MHVFVRFVRSLCTAVAPFPSPHCAAMSALIERRGFRKVADLALCILRLAGNWDSTDFYLAGGSGNKPGDDPHGGRFTCPVRPEKSKDFSLFHGKGKVVYCGFVTKLFCEVFDFDHGL